MKRWTDVNSTRLADELLLCSDRAVEVPGIVDAADCRWARLLQLHCSLLRRRRRLKAHRPAPVGEQRSRVSGHRRHPAVALKCQTKHGRIADVTSIAAVSVLQVRFADLYPAPSVQ